MQEALAIIIIIIIKISKGDHKFKINIYQKKQLREEQPEKPIEVDKFSPFFRVGAVRKRYNKYAKGWLLFIVSIMVIII